ncbi:hypothetical protein WJ36_23710 [Burkholderia ubonensis]|nr:hypothetical protein WJ36_23710 [Burkholderia ubonensis]
MAVGAYEHPLARRQRVGLTKVAAFINEIAARTESMNVQARARLYQLAIDIVANERPVRTLEQFEETR